MPDDEFRVQSGIRTTRRRIVSTGAKLAYSAPLIAASFALTGEGALATGCPCPTGSYAIPDDIIRLLRQLGKTYLANQLSGKCVGCLTGSLTIPRFGGLATACLNLGKTVTSICPGTGNKIVLFEPNCVSH